MIMREPSDPLMTTRTAVILTISLLAGLGAGALLMCSAYHIAEAVLGGIGVFIAALKFLHQWIAPRAFRPRRITLTRTHCTSYS